MCLQKRSESNVRNEEKIASAAPESQSGQQELSNEGALREFLSDSIRNAVAPAAIGVCVGLLSSGPRKSRNPIPRAFVFGVLGGVIGLGAGVAWESRSLVANAARRTSEEFTRMRDERWMKRNFIAYA